MFEQRTEYIERSALIEKFFHAFNEQREIAYQGKITADLGEGYYLAQLYEWLGGSPSCQKIFPLPSMLDWQLLRDRGRDD